VRAPGQGIKNKIAAILNRTPAEKLKMLRGKAVIEIKPPSSTTPVRRPEQCAHHELAHPAHRANLETEVHVDNGSLR
jgi:hypothetical protein